MYVVSVYVSSGESINLTIKYETYNMLDDKRQAKTLFTMILCKKFGISDYMSVNHETPCDIRDEDMELLKECEKRGFIQIRNKR